MPNRLPNGNFLVEHVAVLFVIFVVLTFPLINLAASAYRYNMICGAARAAAHQAADCATFTGTVIGTGPGVAQAVPTAVTNYLKNANGVSNVTSKYRINQSEMATQIVTNTAWGQKLPVQPDTSKYIYSIEIVVEADVLPLVPMVGIPAVPQVPGLTGPSHQIVASQQLAENPAGMNQ